MQDLTMPNDIRPADKFIGQGYVKDGESVSQYCLTSGEASRSHAHVSRHPALQVIDSGGACSAVQKDVREVRDSTRGVLGGDCGGVHMEGQGEFSHHNKHVCGAGETPLPGGTPLPGETPRSVVQWEDSHMSYNFDIRNGPVQISWFKGASTNLCYNCLDRNIERGLGAETCFIWEGLPSEQPAKRIAGIANDTALRLRATAIQLRYACSGHEQNELLRGARGGVPCGQLAEGAGSGARGLCCDLHADGAAAANFHAGMCAHWRRAFGRVRRLQR
jgi:hypothetical protein